MGSSEKAFDVIVVGGGAAGLMCASMLGKQGNRVVVLERTSKPGKKILMSGGGRCNFTNMDITPENYLSNNPHFCKSALSRYTQWDFIGLVCDYGISYHEKKLGQLFCDESSKDILNMLLAECEKAGVEIHTRCEIYELSDSAGYRLDTSKGVYRSENVVIASGGLSIPSMGVTGFGYEVAEQFGMRVLPTRAGLVPFTLSDKWKEVSNRLSGLSADVLLENEQAAFRENLLFTHRGMSGPSVLQLSSYWHAGESITIDLLPEEQSDFLIPFKASHPKSQLKTILTKYLPKKLVAELVSQWWEKDSEAPLAELSNTTLESIGDQLTRWQIKPSGTEGYRTAEVTLGGVDTEGLSSKTMESNVASGLYFIGEVVDVTGHLGGYNFQWAWSSAFAAAEAIGSK